MKKQRFKKYKDDRTARKKVFLKHTFLFSVVSFIALVNFKVVWSRGQYLLAGVFLLFILVLGNAFLAGYKQDLDFVDECLSSWHNLRPNHKNMG